MPIGNQIAFNFDFVTQHVFHIVSPAVDLGGDMRDDQARLRRGLLGISAGGTGRQFHRLDLGDIEKGRFTHP